MSEHEQHTPDQTAHDLGEFEHVDPTDGQGDQNINATAATVATVAVVAVGALVFEAALIPGIALGVAAMLVPRFLPQIGSALDPLVKPPSVAPIASAKRAERWLLGRRGTSTIWSPRRRPKLRRPKMRKGARDATGLQVDRALIRRSRSRAAARSSSSVCFAARSSRVELMRALISQISRDLGTGAAGRVTGMSYPLVNRHGLEIEGANS